MMDRSLLTLIGLRTKAMGRRAVRTLKTPRGAITFGFGLLVFGLWMSSFLVGVFAGGRTDPALTRELFPMVLLAFAIIGVFSTMGERAIYFAPAEVNFLFTGPFTRRELLQYKIAMTAFGMLVTSLIFSVFILRHVPFWPAAYIGVLLSLMFVHLLSMTVALAGEWMAQQAFNKARKLVLLAIAAVLFAAAWQVFGSADPGDPIGMLRQIRSAPGMRWLLMPLAPFAHTVTAQGWGPIALWGCASLGVNALLFGVILRLDANYMESAARISEKVYTRAKQARRTGLAPAKSSRRRVPPLPHLCGVGPMLWRQLTTAVRGSFGMLVTLFIMGVAFPVIVARSGGHETLWGISAGICAWFTVIFSNALRFDFRGDVDHIEVLKALPIHPWALSLGQIAAPALVITVIQAAALFAPAVLTGAWHYLAAAIVLLFPVNLLLFAVDNFIFLLFPMRMAARSAGDLQFFGRQILVFITKVLFVGTGVGIALIPAFLAYAVGLGVAPGLSVTWIILLAEVAMLMPALAWAFNRFDPSTDTPD